jgi:AGZA family xanthine/uracil permease-like MFS transporter
MYPILVFVGLEIMAQSFHATPPKHYPGLAIAVLPALACLVVLLIKGLLGPGYAGLTVEIHLPGTEVHFPPSPEAAVMVQTLRCLANGFLISSLLWAAALAMILDGRLRAAAAYFGVAGICAFFGIVHSPLPDEKVWLPWQVMAEVPPALREAASFQTPYHWTAAYALMALLLLGLSLVPAPAEKPGPVAVPGEGDGLPEEPVPAAVGGATAVTQRPQAVQPAERGHGP